MGMGTVLGDLARFFAGMHRGMGVRGNRPG